MNNWYSKNWCKQKQQALYDLLVIRHKVDASLLKGLLDEFVDRHIEPPSTGNQHSIKHIFLHLTSNEGFGKFLAIVTEKTGAKFKRTPKQKRKPGYMSYGEWFQRAQMDGSLAYNGVTDDF